MKTQKIAFKLALLGLVIFLAGNTTHAQESIPAEVASLVNMKLEEGQNKLSALGYEICSSSYFGKKQGWYNEITKHCITVKFNKNEIITEVLQNPEISECQKGLEASRKLWENYHDGQAPVEDAKINEERKKLADQGFRVTYWVNDVSPGRCAEYWVNDEKKSTMHILWETQGNQWVMTNETDFSYGENPAPKK